MDSIDSYRLLVWLHVVAVIVGLGVTFVYPFLQGFAERRGVQATRFALQFSQRLETIAVWPGAALVFLFGLGLIFNDYPGYKDDMPTWLNVAVLWFLVAVAVAVFVQRRNVIAGIKALEGVPDGPNLPAAYLAVSKRLQMVGGLLGLSVIGITFLMVWKPGS